MRPSSTHPSVQSVQLIGSWDGFNQSYTMERDVRRGRGQWRGCYSFRDIICDDASDTGKQGLSYKRNGGLKMGHTYYYYVRRSSTSSFSINRLHHLYSLSVIHLSIHSFIHQLPIDSLAPPFHSAQYDHVLSRLEI